LDLRGVLSALLRIALFARGSIGFITYRFRIVDAAQTFIRVMTPSGCVVRIVGTRAPIARQLERAGISKDRVDILGLVAAFLAACAPLASRANRSARAAPGDCTVRMGDEGRFALRPFRNRNNFISATPNQQIPYGNINRSADGKRGLRHSNERRLSAYISLQRKWYEAVFQIKQV
jgi:hypothetical protein